MKFEVLGCSGGVSNATHHTSAFLIDDDLLLDCGTGVMQLDLDRMRKLRHIFLTHAHLDHFVSLPFLLDIRCNEPHDPVTVYATAETITLLKTHVFNDQIWPDFTKLPDPSHPHLRFEEVAIGQSIRIGKSRIAPHPARHTISCVSYMIEHEGRKLFYSGDTATSPEMLEAIQTLTDRDYLIIETTFTDEQCELAHHSLHLCPRTLAEIIDALNTSPTILITHHKPGHGEKIMDQITRHLPRHDIQALRSGQIIEL